MIFLGSAFFLSRNWHSVNGKQIDELFFSCVDIVATTMRAAERRSRFKCEPKRQHIRPMWCSMVVVVTFTIAGADKMYGQCVEACAWHFVRVTLRCIRALYLHNQSSSDQKSNFNYHLCASVCGVRNKHIVRSKTNAVLSSSLTVIVFFTFDVRAN